MTALPKPQRIQDRALLDSVKESACLVCGNTQTDPCHIKSVGAGGHDESGNCLSLCRHHHSQQHALGWSRFVGLHPRMELELNKLGWEFIVEFGVMRLRRKD